MEDKKTHFGMEWTYQFDTTTPRVSMKLHREATLDEQLEAFKEFLQACGYIVDGTIEIVNEDKND